MQNPYQFGYQSVKMMAKLSRNEAVEIPGRQEDRYSSMHIITKEGGEGRLKATEEYIEVKEIG